MAGWALITGASAGIGAELARGFAARGYDLVVCARREDRLEALAEELRGQGRQVVVMAVDLRRRSAARRLARRLDVLGIEVCLLVNNAGAAMHGAFAEQDEEALDEMLAVNVRALTALTRQLVPGMLARRAGRILNLASVVAFQPAPSLAVYAATKAFVLSFTEALSEELRGTGVTATALCPGLTRTEMLDDLPVSARRLLDPAPSSAMLDPSWVQGMVVQDARAVAREGVEACAAGEVVRVTGVLNQFATLWSQYQPRWLVRTMAGMAGRAAIAQAQQNSREAPPRG